MEYCLWISVSAWTIKPGIMNTGIIPIHPVLPATKVKPNNTCNICFPITRVLIMSRKRLNLLPSDASFKRPAAVKLYNDIVMLNY